MGSMVPNCIATYQHSHKFSNLPLDLKDDNKEVRIDGKNNENPFTYPAKPLANVKK